MDVFEYLVKRVNDCNFHRQPSLALLFSKPEEKAPVLCNHSEFNIEKFTALFFRTLSSYTDLEYSDPKQ